MGPWKPTKRSNSGLADKPGKARRLLTNESIVQQKIRDNFKHFGPEETDVRKGPDGLTLRARLLADLATAKQQGDGSVIFGKLYYDTLKSIYAKPCVPHVALLPADPDLVVNPALVKAMLAAQKAKPDRGPFLQYMTATLEEPNATELCGIFRWFITLKVGCMKQLAVAMECLKFVSRMRLHVTQAEKFKVINYWVDDVLCAALAKGRAQKTSDKTFTDLNKPLIELLLPKQALNKVLSCSSDWSSVSAELLQLVTECNLGRHLFEGSMAQVKAKDIETMISDAIKETFDIDETVTEEQVREAKRKVVHELHCAAGADFVPQKREVKLNYRGQEVPVKIGGIPEEVDLKFSAAIKGIAVRESQLQKLWCEDLLADGPDTTFKARIDPALVKQGEAARALAKTMITDACVSTADVLAKLFHQKTAALLLMDPYFKVELGLVNLITGEGSEGRLSKSILKCMPSAGNIFGPEAAAQKLHSLAAGELFKMSSRSCQEQLKLAQELVAAIVQARVPDVEEALNCKFLKDVVTSFQWFVSFSPSSSSSGQEDTVYGTDAMKLMLADCKQKHKEQQATLQDVAPLKVFLWLLPDALQTEANHLAKEISASASKVLPTVKGKSSKSKSSKGQDHALKQALDMFK